MKRIELLANILHTKNLRCHTSYILTLVFLATACQSPLKNASMDDMNRRISLDFSKDEKTIRAELAAYFPDLDEEQFLQWQQSQKLENRLINGERRFFRNAVPNLFRVDSVAHQAKLKVDGPDSSTLPAFRLQHTQNLLNELKATGTFEPKQFEITFTLTVDADAVPAGETLRCWLPFPRVAPPRQTNVELHKTSQDNYQLADNRQLQRSLYMEQKALAKTPTKFSYTASFETLPAYFNLNQLSVESYHTNDSLFQHYTSERPPHIVFSQRMQDLADSIVGDSTDPIEKVQKIYYWINRHIPWASALEYSTFECIPAYVLDHQKGDCGMQTLLFMTLARIKGIPCKWQSGWMLHPGNKNLHDWCEVYYEGIGWVPLDQSFGLQNTQNQQLRDFYINGMDRYRLIFNDDFSKEFNPQKAYPRSEPIDFQRGEVEWKNDNLYFDQWTYSLVVKELN